ncbi:hypothetical protein MKK84_24305 [Methylobacterium sp. E-065]|uniref:hypothetical protein n=1 Tax=Methylobacterium sp. E-065 TaxID=2836583 RepID=UPI001FB8F4B1|nr:hypothetical protein [Methylobacterium sp. E-065]MCJ2020514.1 hypothetical protein [Methylobacterium sp. E-065]
MTRRKPDPRRPGPDHYPDDDWSMSEPVRLELVAETAAIFGEEAARELAGLLCVPFKVSQPEIRL